MIIGVCLLLVLAFFAILDDDCSEFFAEFSVWQWSIGIVVFGFLWGILFREPKKEVVEKNRKIVSDAKEELAKKEAELKKLTCQK